MSDEQQAIEATPATTPDATGIEAQRAAAAAAMGEEPAKTEPETPAASETPADDGMSTVAKVLKEREAAQAARDDRAAAKAEADAARAEASKLKAEAEQDRAAAKSERERIEKLRANPMAAIKELGWDAKRLVDEVTREGSPEWVAQQRYEAQLAELKAETSAMRAWREDREKADAAAKEQQGAYARHQVESRFLESFPAESAARLLYEEADIVKRGHEIADAYTAKSGKVASLEELRDYIEEQAAKRLAAIRQPQGDATGSKAPAAAAKLPTKTPGNGPRALSGNAASERRASPKPHHEMTDAEQRQAQIDAANAAMNR